MTRSQPTLFEETRLTQQDAVELTAASLLAYADTHEHWVLAYSGGKDSSAALVVVTELIEQGQVPRPKTLTLLYADTRQELPPLQIAARGMLERAAAKGWRTRVVLPELDHRYMVYILGRGVPPPSNSFRWCTPKLKVAPMERALREELAGLDGKVLVITGVRLGESAARDGRIAMSCGKDGAECGQGWFQQGLAGAPDALAPLLHWRVCHVWDYLVEAAVERGWPTGIIAEAYGGDEALEDAARTGCVGCPLVSKESALERVLRLPQWAYLAPLARLQPLYREIKLPRYRLRKDGYETRKDGSRVPNPQRMGPLTLGARVWALEQVLSIQAEVNDAAVQFRRPAIDLINAEEEARIRQLILAGTWPDGWEGTELTADVPLDVVYRDGSVQPILL